MIESWMDRTQFREEQQRFIDLSIAQNAINRWWPEWITANFRGTFKKP